MLRTPIQNLQDTHSRSIFHHRAIKAPGSFLRVWGGGVIVWKLLSAKDISHNCSEKLVISCSNFTYSSCVLMPSLLLPKTSRKRIRVALLIHAPEVVPLEAVFLEQSSLDAYTQSCSKFHRLACMSGEAFSRADCMPMHNHDHSSQEDLSVRSYFKSDWRSIFEFSLEVKKVSTLPFSALRIEACHVRWTRPHGCS